MKSDVLLREVTVEDLPIFFEHQLDSDANQMAAFPPRDRETFMAHWSTKILGNETVIRKTILFKGLVAGNIVSWEQSGKQEVGYWIGKEYWGKGIATKALSELLIILKVRPLYAHVAKHNIASLRVLEKCGFTIIGEDKLSSNSFDKEVEEFILSLEANEHNNKNEGGAPLDTRWILTRPGLLEQLGRVQSAGDVTRSVG